MDRNTEFSTINKKEAEDSAKEKARKSRESPFDREDKIFLFKAGAIFIFFIVIISVLFGTVFKDPFDSPKKMLKQKSTCGNEICGINEDPSNCPKDCKLTVKEDADNTKPFLSFLYDKEGKLITINLIIFGIGILIFMRVFTR